MTTIGTHGFLSHESERSVSDFESRYSEIVKLYRDLDAFAHRAKYEFCGGGRDAQQILVALLFGRALSAYEGIYLLASRGMEQDYQALLRTLLDVMFHALAAEKSPENVRAIIWASEFQKKVIVRALLEENKKANPSADHAEVEEILRKHETSLDASGAKKLTISEIMNMADVPSWMYQLAYRSLCLSAHPDANRLQKALNVADDGSVTQIGWGPQYETVEMELSLAMHILMLVLDCESLGMPGRMMEEMNAIKEGLAEFNSRLAKRAD